MTDYTEYLVTDKAINITDNEDGSFAAARQQVFDGLATLNANPGDLGELLGGDARGTGGFILTPEALGQILMDHLPINANERLHANEKAYWLAVADWLGPDWLASMRKVAAFMDKVESF
jgi:hypothetical protein